MAPRPARERFADPRRPDALVVQFVVDTAGRVDARSFRVLQAPTPAADRVPAVLGRWRLAPAVRGGCTVPQLLRTAVAH